MDRTGYLEPEVGIEPTPPLYKSGTLPLRHSGWVRRRRPARRVLLPSRRGDPVAAADIPGGQPGDRRTWSQERESNPRRLHTKEVQSHFAIPAFWMAWSESNGRVEGQNLAREPLRHRPVVPRSQPRRWSAESPRPPAGFQPASPGLTARRLLHIQTTRRPGFGSGAEKESRTPVPRLGTWCSAIELPPQGAGDGPACRRAALTPGYKAGEYRVWSGHGDSNPDRELGRLVCCR